VPPEIALRAMGRLARGVRTPQQAWINYWIRALGPVEDWPTDRLVVTAIDIADGSRLAMDRTTGVPLARALAATSAIGGLLPAITVDGHQYIVPNKNYPWAVHYRKSLWKEKGYKVPTIRDVPKITVRFVDVPDRRANNLGSKGLGEPPIIPTPAAIGNAVANAIGVRVRTTPITPARVLEALALR